MNLAEAFAVLDAARYRSELYRQWHAGQRAGLLHHQVIATTDPLRRSPTVRRVRAALLAGLERRETITAVVKRHGDLFHPFEAALLVLGEETGQLESTLRLLGDHFAAEQRLVVWLKKKLAYPMFNALAACVIAPLPLLFLGSTGAYVVTACGGLALLIGAGGALLLAAARRYAQRPAVVQARLLRALATGVEAGLSLDRVVDLALAATASPVIAAHVARIPRTRRLQQPLAETFAGCPTLPAELLASLRVADATGNYTDTLRRLADLYEDGFR